MRIVLLLNRLKPKSYMYPIMILGLCMGPWHWAHYPPVYWHYPSHYAHFSHNRRHHSPFYWGPRVHISFGFFFSSFHWHNRHVVRIPTHHYRPYAHHSRREVIRHEHANRWRHNPTHRAWCILSKRNGEQSLCKQSSESK